jgi:hypothetical protein
MAPSARGAKPTRVKVREHRERLRAQGLRPIQIWVPDVRSASFRSEAHRQSAAVAASAPMLPRTRRSSKRYPTETTNEARRRLDRLRRP